MLNVLVIVVEPSSEEFQNGVRKSVIKEIKNDQNPPLYRIEVVFWKDEASSKNLFLKMMKKIQPAFIVLKDGFLLNEVETIKHVIDTNKKNCLKRSAKLKLFRVSKGSTIKTPDVKTLYELSDLTKESA